MHKIEPCLNDNTTIILVWVHTTHFLHHKGTYKAITKLCPFVKIIYRPTYNMLYFTQHILKKSARGAPVMHISYTTSVQKE